MTKFPYNFPKTIIALLIGGVVAGIACFVMNLLSFISFLGSTSATEYNYISVLLSMLIGIIAVVVCVSMMINSYYGVDNKKLIIRWGIICNAYPLDSIKEVVYSPKDDRLIVHLDSNEFFYISVKNVCFTDFTTELLKKNKKIEYFELLEDKEEKEEENDKK